ncbi:MAG: hypothetical protein AAGA20_06760 [Planctomycetota bacterium]
MTMLCSPLLHGVAVAALAAPLYPLPEPTLSSPSGEDDLRVKIDHEKLANDFLQRAGIDPEKATDTSIEDLLDDGFYTMRLGLFDLAVAAHELEDRTKGDDFALLAVALLDVQDNFLDWLGPDAPGARDARKDLDRLRDWCSGLRGNAIDDIEGEPGELTVGLEAPDRVIEAQAAFGAYMATGKPLGLERTGELVDTFIVAPDRRAFLELVSAFGAMSPSNQYSYWSDDILTWTNCYYNEISVVALEFADPEGTTPGNFAGIDMNSRSPTGMQQQIAQLAGNTLFDNMYGEKIPPSLAGAFSVNNVIDIYGECNTRIDGDLRVRRSEALEIFVPGGRSEGGVLPPNLADSRWRGEHGKDRYLVALQGAQSAGENQAKKRADRVRLFVLQDDDMRSRMALRAPFLGSPALANELIIPDEFYGDSLEFFRSYRTGFVYWLQQEGMRSSKAARSAFGEVLSKLAQADAGADSLEATIEEVYGRPLSSEDPVKEDLEGEFLIWLSKL